VAAGKCKSWYDATIKSTPLTEGQQVYMQDHGVRGRNKIQDKWSSMLFKVLHAPGEDGQVYAIAPVDNPGMCIEPWYVHQTSLKQ